jgi:aspartate racemase
MHIGLIGGIGPAATEFYYRNLVRAHVAANCVLDLTIVHIVAFLQ